MREGVGEDNPGVGNRHDSAGAERTHYFALQTARAPTLIAPHHIVSALNNTLTDMHPAHTILYIVII